MRKNKIGHKQLFLIGLICILIGGVFSCFSTEIEENVLKYIVYAVSGILTFGGISVIIFASDIKHKGKNSNQD